jgi:hypothetical protein
VRTLFAAAFTLALAAPALAQTPPPETLTFEGLAGKTPVAYAENAAVPAAARLKQLTLAGGGMVRFRTRGGAKYVALVSHFGTTGIAPVSKKGKIALGRFLDIDLRKTRGARFDSMVAIQAGKHVDDNGTPTDATDDITTYDNPGDAAFRMYDSKKQVYPQNGALLSLVRSGADPLNLVKDPYNLATTSLDFVRLQLLPAGGGVGGIVFDDFVVSFGH